MPRGRPIVGTRGKPGRLSPPPERSCPRCLRKMTLTDRTRGKERYACPIHGEPKTAA